MNGFSPQTYFAIIKGVGVQCSLTKIPLRASPLCQGQHKRLPHGAVFAILRP